MKDDLYENLLSQPINADTYKFWEAVSDHLAGYINWEPLAFAIRAGLETLPLKEE